MWPVPVITANKNSDRDSVPANKSKWRGKPSCSLSTKFTAKCFLKLVKIDHSQVCVSKLLNTLHNWVFCSSICMVEEFVSLVPVAIVFVLGKIWTLFCQLMSYRLVYFIEYMIKSLFISLRHSFLLEGHEEAMEQRQRVSEAKSQWRGVHISDSNHVMEFM